VVNFELERYTYGIGHASHLLAMQECILCVVGRYFCMILGRENEERVRIRLINQVTNFSSWISVTVYSVQRLPITGFMPSIPPDLGN
jgi:hypothetical protein